MDSLKILENLEKSKKLDSSIILGVNWWDLCRYRASQIIQTFSDNNNLLVLRRPSFKNLLFRTCSFFYRIIKMKYKKRSIVFLAHPRLKNDDTYTDIYTDSILEECKSEFDIIQLEPVRKSHESQRLRDFNRVPLDFIYIISGIAFKFIDQRNKVLGKKEHIIDDLKNEMSGVLSKLLDENKFFNYSYERIIKFKIHRKFYLTLLKFLRPRLVVISVSAGNEAFISASQILGLRVIEMQHGSPTLGKLNYDYSSGIKKKYAPDFFFGFGQFFSSINKFLPSSINYKSIGYPYLQKKINDYANLSLTKDESKILFISQPTIDNKLQRFIIKNKKIFEKKQCYIALHPGYSDLNRDPFSEIGFLKRLPAASDSLYRGLVECGSVVGGYSTALYEAHAFECKVYVIDELSYGMMDEGVKKGYFNKVFLNTVYKDIHELLKISQSSNTKNLFKTYKDGEALSAFKMVLNNDV